MMPGSRASDAQRVAEAVRRALEVKMTLDGHIVDVRASIGIAACPDHGTDPTKLLERADVAMHAAKRDQLGIALWDERYDEHGEQRLSLMSDLRKAVDNDELALIYQPKIALGEAGEHYVEALVRWQHPTARARAAVRVRSARRADRLHPDDHAMGARARDRPVRRVAQPRACR